MDHPTLLACFHGLIITLSSSFGPAFARITMIAEPPVVAHILGTWYGAPRWYLLVTKALISFPLERSRALQINPSGGRPRKGKTPAFVSKQWALRCPGICPVSCQLTKYTREG